MGIVTTSDMRRTTADRGQGMSVALAQSSRKTAFSSRLMECLSRAFRDIGTSPLMEDLVYWRLSLEMKDVIGQPRRFVEALTTFFGDAGAAVYEYKLVEEVQKEFDLHHTAWKEHLDGKRPLGELFREAVNAAWTAP